MTADLRHEFDSKPLNRGFQAVSGIILVMIIFVGAGPLIGTLAATGTIGFFLYIWVFAYPLGAIPAAVAGCCFSVLWLAGVHVRTRYLATAAVGGLAGAVVPSIQSGPSVLTITFLTSGVVAAIACSWLATYLFRRTEAERLRRAR